MIPSIPNPAHCESPHRNYGQNKGNPCKNYQNNPPTLPDETDQSDKVPPTCPKPPLNKYMAEHNLPSPTITHYESPNGSYGLKQGNPCPNSLPIPSPLPKEAKESEKATLTPPKPPTAQTQAYLPHNSVNCTILTGRHGLTQGNPSTPSLSEHLHPPQMALKLPPSDSPNSSALLNKPNPFDPTQIKVDGFQN